MSLGARATKGGARAGKDGKHAQDKGKPTDKPQPKEKVKLQATTEQIRMANMIDCKSEDTTDVRRMVTVLMEMTCRTEEEVCSALHDSDNDMLVACNLLLEESERIQGGRGAGRGGRRGGTRTRPSRDTHWNDNNDAGGNIGDTFPATEDWDNEEWSGSLSDTKVFTPSVNVQNLVPELDTASQNATEDWECPPESNGPTDAHVTSYTYHNTAQAHHHQSMLEQQQQQQQQVLSAPKPEPAAAPAPSDPHLTHHHQEDWECPPESNGPTDAHVTSYTYHNTAQAHHHQSMLEEDWECPPESNGPTDAHVTSYTYHNTAQAHHHQSMLEVITHIHDTKVFFF
ncbi:Protein lingerer [Papilio machaon]|uniref:Protein lingerer n=1 Tax=Papilio machaon TaxID=76193 RepID=A0A194RBT1_PAPMA|nr:Protein lingerer [Papilio machaon]